jgi:predicted amidohydrolase
MDQLLGALQPSHLAEVSSLEQVLDELKKISEHNVEDGSAAIALAIDFFLHDCARIPYRRVFFPNAKETLWLSDPTVKAPTERSTSSFIEEEVVEGVAVFQSNDYTNDQSVLEVPLLFPTRPFTLPELYLLKPRLLSDHSHAIRSLSLAFRGFPPKNFIEASTPNKSIAIPFPRRDRNIRIIVTSWETKLESWIAVITHQPEPDDDRFRRLNTLLNRILKCSVRPDYIVFPELSIPSKWFPRIAKKLWQNGISVIAGVEYIHESEGKVLNQVWSSLTTNFFGYPSAIIHRQTKAQPALHEESELFRIANKRMSTSVAGELEKPVINHGRFAFGILICSELTNIEHRRSLRGKVDAVFVPEWNQDVDTFASLVEASALDVHAYIIQVNNRAFGDSRIRLPAKQPWQRDIVRVKGGLEDYFVIGEIDINNLRKFQSVFRSDPDGSFKPVPDGFEIDEKRKMLP